MSFDDFFSQSADSLNRLVTVLSLPFSSEMDILTLLKFSLGLLVIAVSIKLLIMLRRHLRSGHHTIPRETPTTRRRAKRMAGQLIKQQHYAEAAEMYERIGEDQRAIDAYTEAKDYSHAGLIYERRKEWEKAVTMYERAQEFEKAGEIYKKLKQYPQAVEMFTKAGRELVAAEIYERDGQPLKAADIYEKVGDLANAARSYARAGNHEKAARVLEEYYLRERQGALTEDVQTTLASTLEKSSRLYVQAGLPGEAARLLLYENNLSGAASAYLQAGDLPKAAELFETARDYAKAAEVCQKMGKGEKAYQLLAEMHLQQGESREAAEMFSRADAHEHAGLLYERIGDLRQAAEAYLRGKDYTKAAENFISLGDEERAAQAYEEGKMWQKAAELSQKLGKTDKAAHLYESAGNYYTAGLLCQSMGMVDETINLLQKVDQNSENYATASKILGKIFVEKGMLGPAKEKFQKVLAQKAISPDVLESYYHLALIHEMLGDFEEALSIYEKIVAEEYSYMDVRNRIENLKKLLTERSLVDKQTRAGPSATAPLPLRYKILKEIGRGGMGVVYQAEDLVLKRIVAFKVLPDNVKENPKVLESFLQEARTAAVLNHTNIVTVYDTGKAGNDYFITMEFVDGITLKQRLEKQSPLPLPEVLLVTKQLCLGLDYAHSKNVIHRDIKPGNVMITKENVVKIMDFGLAKVKTESASEKTTVKGTPLYMAPEQIQGKQVDHCVDLYSLGCTMYRMIVGRPPFIEGDIYYHHLHTPPVPPHALRPDIPEILNNIVLKCLEKDKVKRYQKALDILQDVESVAVRPAQGLS